MRTGRPTKTDAPRLRRIVAAFRRGSTTRQAALAGGISPSTLADWLTRGREYRDPGFREFTSKVDAALAELRAECEARWAVAHAERLSRKAIDDARYAAWRKLMDFKIAENRQKFVAAAEVRAGRETGA